MTALAHSIGRRVLEVGCSNGAMLQQWGSDWVKSGIEPSMASAKVANQSGINVVGILATLGVGSGIALCR